MVLPAFLFYKEEEKKRWTVNIIERFRADKSLSYYFSRTLLIDLSFRSQFAPKTKQFYAFQCLREKSEVDNLSWLSQTQRWQGRHPSVPLRPSLPWKRSRQWLILIATQEEKLNRASVLSSTRSPSLSQVEEIPLSVVFPWDRAESTLWVWMIV